jgi:hypothetical protein
MSVYKLLTAAVVVGFLWNATTDTSAMIPEPRDEQIIALQKERDFYAAKADFLQKTAIIQQMFRGISNALWVDPLYGFNSTGYSVDGNVWRQLLRSMRYLGGDTNTPNLVENGAPGTAIAQFMTHIPNPLDRVYVVDNTPAIIPNINAVFASFIGEYTVDNIRAIANGNLSYGFRDIRIFLNTHFPNLAEAFRRMGEDDFWTITTLTDLGGEYFESTNINNAHGRGGGNNNGNANGDIRWDLATSLAEIFGTTTPFKHLDNLDELGLVGGTQEQLNAVLEDIRRLYNSN